MQGHSVRALTTKPIWVCLNIRGPMFFCLSTVFKLYPGIFSPSNTLLNDEEAHTNNLSQFAAALRHPKMSQQQISYPTWAVTAATRLAASNCCPGATPEPRVDTTDAAATTGTYPGDRASCCKSIP